MPAVTEDKEITHGFCNDLVNQVKIQDATATDYELVLKLTDGSLIEIAAKHNGELSYWHKVP